MSFFSDFFSWFRRKPVTPPPPPPAGDVSTELLRSHNAERLSRGLLVLTLNAALGRAAQGHAEWMAAKGILSHNQGLQQFTVRLLAQSYSYTSAAENIAQGQRIVAEVMQSWMSSIGHRTNILGRYDDVGFGVAKAANGEMYWCVDFGTD